MAHPRVMFYGLEDAKTVMHSEEHLVLQTDRAHAFSVGHVLYGLPRHVCPTIALHDQVHVVRNGQATELWSVIARKRHLNC